MGNKNCQDPDKLPETKDEGKCPRWANVGCYTGTAQHEVVSSFAYYKYYNIYFTFHEWKEL